jgi:hypothetical protein
MKHILLILIGLLLIFPCVSEGRKLTKPLPGTLLNPVSELQRDLVLYLPLFEGGGSQVQDLNTYNSRPVSGVNWVSNTNGNALYFPGAATNTIDITGIAIPANSNKTFSFLLKVVSTGALDYLLDSQTGRFILAIRSGKYAHYDGTWTSAAVGPTIGELIQVDIVFTSLATRIDWYVNTKRVSGWSSITTFPVGGTTVVGDYFGKTGAAKVNIALYSVAIWSRALTYRELLAKYHDTYSIFQPKQDWQWFVSVLGSPWYYYQKMRK